MLKKIELTAVYEPCDGGGLIAYIEEIPEINTQGDTLDNAKENLADAINLMFQETRANFRKSFLLKRMIITQTPSLDL